MMPPSVEKCSSMIGSLRYLVGDHLKNCVNKIGMIEDDAYGFVCVVVNLEIP